MSKNINMKSILQDTAVYTVAKVSTHTHPSSPVKEMKSLAFWRSFLDIAITFENASWRKCSRRTVILTRRTHINVVALRRARLLLGLDPSAKFFIQFRLAK